MNNKGICTWEEHASDYNTLRALLQPYMDRGIISYEWWPYRSLSGKCNYAPPEGERDPAFGFVNICMWCATG